MNPHSRVTSIAALAVLLVCPGCGGGARQSEVVLSTHVTLGSRGVDVKPTLPFRALYPRSDLILELPGYRVTADRRIETAQGEPRVVAGYLTTMSGERVGLDSVSGEDHGGRAFLRMSSAALAARRDVQFTSATLWCDQGLDVGKVVWLSYDPASAQGAAPWPQALAPRDGG